MRALGARILNEQGVSIGQGGATLLRAAPLDLSALDPRLADVTIEVAGNMHNLLTGSRGAARVLGSQKGAIHERVEELAAAIDRWPTCCIG